ncbi:UNVERIFIED_CONTAM: hypothetical protein ABIE34_000001, partial [Jeotgalibacillus campisalis]
MASGTDRIRASGLSPLKACQHNVRQHSTTLTARPPIAVSLYLEDMSLPVSRMV